MPMIVIKPHIYQHQPNGFGTLRHLSLIQLY